MDANEHEKLGNGTCSATITSISPLFVGEDDVNPLESNGRVEQWRDEAVSATKNARKFVDLNLLSPREDQTRSPGHLRFRHEKQRIVGRLVNASAQRDNQSTSMLAVHQPPAASRSMEDVSGFYHAASVGITCNAPSTVGVSSPQSLHRSASYDTDTPLSSVWRTELPTPENSIRSQKQSDTGDTTRVPPSRTLTKKKKRELDLEKQNVDYQGPHTSMIHCLDSPETGFELLHGTQAMYGFPLPGSNVPPTPGQSRSDSSSSPFNELIDVECSSSLDTTGTTPESDSSPLTAAAKRRSTGPFYDSGHKKPSSKGRFPIKAATAAFIEHQMPPPTPPPQRELPPLPTQQPHQPSPNINTYSMQTAQRSFSVPQLPLKQNSTEHATNLNTGAPHTIPTQEEAELEATKLSYAVSLATSASHHVDVLTKQKEVLTKQNAILRAALDTVLRMNHSENYDAEEATVSFQDLSNRFQETMKRPDVIRGRSRTHT